MRCAGAGRTTEGHASAVSERGRNSLGCASRCRAEVREMRNAAHPRPEVLYRLRHARASRHCQAGPAADRDCAGIRRPSVTSTTGRRGGAECAKCAAALTPGLKFCTACGTPAQALAQSAVAAQAPPPVARTPQAASTPPQYPPPPAGWPSAPANGPAAPPAEAKSGGALKIVLPILLLLIIGAGGYFAYKHYWQPRQQAIPGSAGFGASAGSSATASGAGSASRGGHTRSICSDGASSRRRSAGHSNSRSNAVGQDKVRLRAGSSRGAGTPAPAASFTPATPVAATPPRVSEPVATPIERVQEPQVPANDAPPPAPQRAEITRPESPAPPVAPARVIPPPAPAVPKSGTLIWSGQLEKDKVLTIDGASASNGTLRGALPGVPVMVEVTPSTVGVAEMPGPTNGWKRIVLRSRNNSNVVVTVKWTVL